MTDVQTIHNATRGVLHLSHPRAIEKRDRVINSSRGLWWERPYREGESSTNTEQAAKSRHHWGSRSVCFVLLCYFTVSSVLVGLLLDLIVCVSKRVLPGNMSCCHDHLRIEDSLGPEAETSWLSFIIPARLPFRPCACSWNPTCLNLKPSASPPLHPQPKPLSLLSDFSSRSVANQSII